MSTSLFKNWLLYAHFWVCRVSKMSISQNLSTLSKLSKKTQISSKIKMTEVWNLHSSSTNIRFQFWITTHIQFENPITRSCSSSATFIETNKNQSQRALILTSNKKFHELSTRTYSKVSNIDTFVKLAHTQKRTLDILFLSKCMESKMNICQGSNLYRS